MTKLYDLSNAHVVFDNGFIESFKDAFLSSNSEGVTCGMQQIQGGMDRLPLSLLIAATIRLRQTLLLARTSRRLIRTRAAGF